MGGQECKEGDAGGLEWKAGRESLASQSFVVLFSGGFVCGEFLCGFWKCHVAPKEDKS